jgi:O-antigen ligase
MTEGTLGMAEGMFGMARGAHASSRAAGGEASVSHGGSGGETSIRFLASLGMTGILLLIACLIIMVAAIIFAQSRGAWISLGISLLVMNIILIRRRFLKVYSLIILITLAVGVFGYFYHSKGLVSKRIETMLDIEKGEASMESRFSIWRGTVEMIKDYPWTGVGIGCFEWGFPKYRPLSMGRWSIRPRYAHNDYLHMAAETGVFGMVFMIWVLCLVVGRALSDRDCNSDNCGQPIINSIILGCGIGMLSLAIHGMVDFNFHIPANMILFVVLAGIAEGEKRYRGEMKSVLDSSSRLRFS